jgi:UDP-glucose 6-dehydrogenase
MINSGVEDEISLVLKSIQYGTKNEKTHLSYGFGMGGSLIPKGNRVLGHYFDKFGLETSNLPNTLNDLNSQHSSFLKKYYMSKNPDKSVPFVMKYLGYKLNSDNLDESQPYQLCIDLLDEGYTLHVIEEYRMINSLSKISEEYDGRLKFFKKGTSPEGHKINL